MTHWTRKMIEEKLIEWKTNNISTIQIWEWANTEWNPMEDGYDDIILMESGKIECCSYVILNLLENIERNFITNDDIDILLEFLKTPIEESQNGIEKLNNYLDNINLDNRKSKLISIEPYSYWNTAQITLARNNKLQTIKDITQILINFISSLIGLFLTWIIFGPFIKIGWYLMIGMIGAVLFWKLSNKITTELFKLIK